MSLREPPVRERCYRDPPEADDLPQTRIRKGAVRIAERPDRHILANDAVVADPGRMVDRPAVLMVDPQPPSRSSSIPQFRRIRTRRKR